MITLRPYQKTLIDELRDKMRTHPRVIVCSPTGSGKRMMACWLAAEIASRGKRVGFVTDRRILVKQLADECRAHDIPYGIVMADSPRRDSAPVQVCSIQTLTARKWKDNPEVDYWIIDEAHKTSSAYKKLLKYYPDAKVVSFTATPVGSGGKSLEGFLGPVVEPFRNRTLIEQGWLLSTKVYAPSEPDVEGVKISGGEWNQDELAKRVEECTIFADVFKWWSPYSDHQTICFAPRVRYAHWLAEQFNKRGHSAATVVGNTPQREREEIFEKFRNREIRLLTSVGVLIEGFDAPIADCGIDLTPNRQFRNFWQKVGRVRRPHEDQKQAIWFDFSGNVWRFPHPDDNPEWPRGNDKIQDTIKVAKEKEPREPWSCPKCGYVLAWWEKPLPNGECRGCGRKPGKPVRRIRMGNGKMREVPLRKQRKHRKSNEQQLWDACRYRCMYIGKPLIVAKKMYEKELGLSPHANLNPRPPAPGSPDWYRKPTDVYPFMRRK